MRGDNRSTLGKTSHGRVEDQQTQSTYDTECGDRTRATLVGGKCSQANPATSTKVHALKVCFGRFIAHSKHFT